MDKVKKSSPADAPESDCMWEKDYYNTQFYPTETTCKNRIDWWIVARAKIGEIASDSTSLLTLSLI